MKRINFKVIASYLPVSQDLQTRFMGMEHLVADKLSQLYGGCTSFLAAGYWTEDGDETKEGEEKYGNLCKELAIQFECSIEPEKFDKDKIKECFEPFKEFCKWIHFEHWETEVDHFKIGE